MKKAISDINLQKIDYTHNFEEIKQFLAKYDVYEDPIEQEKFINFSIIDPKVISSISRLSLMKKIEEMY